MSGLLMHGTGALRRLPIGAEPLAGAGVHFRVWAPNHETVEVALEGGPGANGDGTAVFRSLAPEPGGYFSATVEDASAGTLYRYRLGNSNHLCPDPASRFQPEGPHGPSEVVDPDNFRWTDSSWRGVKLKGQVIYEMHAGTFTPEGTWEAATRELPELAGLGITVIEVMPVSEFPGSFGWGYDGVDIYAPTRLYGRPDDFRAFVDTAHALGMGVILDVVYNHLGPDGNYLLRFSKDYMTDACKNEWGDAINFDGENSQPVREFFVENAGYWIAEYHLDGLRLDATQSICDRPERHVLAAITRRVREAARGRSTIVVAENEPQQARLVRSLERGGYGIDALWNDDFHHSAMVALTGRNEAYYTDYLGTPQEFISALKWGFLYQGQHYRWQKKRRGSPAFGVPPAAFVLFIQNHDQIANSGRGLRVHELTSPGRFRAMTALTLLAPGTPMLFQGQEFCASSPFLYFADHTPELAARVRKGREEFVSQFPSVATPEMRAQLPDPASRSTFEASKLDHAEREENVWAVRLHRDLLRLRREDPVFGAQEAGQLDGAVLGPAAFVLRFFGEKGDDRLLLVNLGTEIRLERAPEPLLAPPEGGRWAPLWNSEDPCYGGSGVPHPESEEGTWVVPGESAIALRALHEPLKIGGRVARGGKAR